MSSSTSLTRSRSLGKPATSDTKMQKGEVQQQTEARNTSPSRLPVKGPSRQDTASAGIITATTSLNKNSASGGQRAGLGGSAATASHTRPISGLFGRSASVRQPQTSNTAGVTVSRPPITTRNRPTAAQTQSSSASGGAANIRRPTSSSGVAPSTATNTTAPMTTARGPGHARAKSSVTALSTATTLRPPSSQTSSGASTATTERGSRSGGSGGSSRMAHQRQPSAASAVSSVETQTTSRQTRSATVSTSGPTTRSATAAATQQQQQQQQPRLRPTFTTLQQHYSPAKSLAPKPLTATFLAPPSPSKLPANVAASAETARLQSELLQLHLLHRAAGPTALAWRQSARNKLRARFEGLALEAEDVARREAEAASRANEAALRRQWWGRRSVEGSSSSSGNPSDVAAFEERVRALDEVLAGVWGLGEPGGRYARVARRFERWVERVVEVVGRRQRREGGVVALGQLLLSQSGDPPVLFVSELEVDWRDECTLLMHKLEEWRGMLGSLEGAHPGQGDTRTGEDEDSEDDGSSLGRILAGCRSLLDDVLTELELMQQIERDALIQEKEWIRSMDAEIGSEETDHSPSTASSRAGAIWRVL